MRLSLVKIFDVKYNIISMKTITYKVKLSRHEIFVSKIN